MALFNESTLVSLEVNQEVARACHYKDWTATATIIDLGKNRTTYVCSCNKYDDDGGQPASLRSPLVLSQLRPIPGIGGNDWSINGSDWCKYEIMMTVDFDGCCYAFYDDCHAQFCGGEKEPLVHILTYICIPDWDDCDDIVKLWRHLEAALGTIQHWW